MKKLMFALIALWLMACETTPIKQFAWIDPSQSGMDFSNVLPYDEDFNIFKYRNFYNGGGVALIDYDNDQLLDIYLISNTSENKLFKNLGGFRFEDVTKVAGVMGTRAWSTGASVADINGDGWQDIYVCNSGDIKGDNKQNELFINNGDGTFSEQAEAYGLADRGFSTHAAFFDYDKDGDLDMYLLNNSYQAIGSFNLRRNERPKRDSIGGDKLYRNEGQQFTDISAEAGIYGSVIGFGLGVTVGDVDKDGWLDIYVSNDFFERDYLYINNHQGGFSEVLEARIKSTSAASMGADMADLNNDSYPEIFVTDMLPATNERVKTVTTFDSWDRYMYGVENGYWHQFTRNTLQLNNADGTFSEIGRFAGVEASDWSWGALIFDFQNDGKKDIFIANGIYQDLTNQDFLRFVTEEETANKVVTGQGVDYKKLISYIPSVPVSNHAYVNTGTMKFENQADLLGLDRESFSSGSAYGDLDNDGDLDLVVNNTNMPFFLYENKNERVHPDNHFIRFVLKGAGANTSAFGAKIMVYDKGNAYYVEQLPIRGFQSTVDFRPLIGVGTSQVVDSITVVWPSDKITQLYGVGTDTTLVLDEKDASDRPITNPRTDNPALFTPDPGPGFVHRENQFVDFDRDRLTFQMLSSQGPCLCSGDINGDGLEDFYVGGAAGQSGSFFVQNQSGGFTAVVPDVLVQGKASEEVTCTMLDANGDGRMDVYIGSGGSEFESVSSELNDKLLINQGDLVFERYRQNFPIDRFENTSTVQAADYDGDGDTDLFVGIRTRAFYYGFPMNGYLLENDGKGKFTDVTAEKAPGLLESGMITGARWADMDGDGDPDLLVVGDWMPVKLYTNEKGRFTLSSPVGFADSHGWWNAIEVADFNQDGRLDVIVANHGTNSRFRASKDKPLTMHVNDFDKNGTIEQIICQYNGDKSYPLSLRHDLSMQIPQVKKKYLKYENYKDQTIEDIFTEKERENTLRLEARELATRVWLNMGDDVFAPVDLPDESQYSCTYALSVADFDADGHLDILMGGNLYQVKPEMGRYDAGYGTLLLGDGTGNFHYLPPRRSGLVLDRQVRNINAIQTATGLKVIVANNNEEVQVFSQNQ